MKKQFYSIFLCCYAVLLFEEKSSCQREKLGHNSENDGDKIVAKWRGNIYIHIFCNAHFKYKDEYTSKIREWDNTELINGRTISKKCYFWSLPIHSRENIKDKL